MYQCTIAAAALVGVLAGMAHAEPVGVPGSHVKYESAILARIGDKDVTLVLTGTAMRKKAIFNIYAIGSYLQEGVAVKTAEELIAADAAKQLILIMERNVDGDDMAKAFRSAVLKNHSAEEFSGELDGFAAFLKDNSVKKGDRVILTHVPGSGFRCTIADKVECQIDNVAFARAIWEIYLGKNNLGESIKRGLVSRLK